MYHLSINPSVAIINNNDDNNDDDDDDDDDDRTFVIIIYCFNTCTSHNLFNNSPMLCSFQVHHHLLFPLLPILPHQVNAHDL